MSKEEYLNLFRMPTPVKITGRISSITNAFVNGIIPCIVPSGEEIENSLSILGMDAHTICCAYCGGPYTEWDHFRPLVRNKRPTGFISEINNLVPSCGKCNQSKGNKDWRIWITSDARLSPKTRNISGLIERIARLEAFEKQSNPIRIDFESVVGKDDWEQHWKNCTLLHEQMKQCQTFSDGIKAKIKGYIEEL